LGNRRGFTLVLMMLMMTVFIGAAAFAVDIGHMYAIRSEVHAAADAAALAGVSEWAVKGALPEGKDSARLEAQAFAVRFKADTVTLSLADADISLGHWAPPSGALSSFTTPAADTNAVKVTIRYNASFSFGRFLGFTAHQVTATAIAVHGSVGSTRCMRPLAIPYQSLLDQLFGVGVKDTSYTLTTSDIAALNQLSTANPIALKLGSPGAPNLNGQFYAVDLPPGEYADGTAGTPDNGGQPYRQSLGAQCSALPGIIGVSNVTVSVGDWLSSEQGNLVGPTNQGIGDFCSAFGCPSKAIVALWSSYGTSPGGHCTHCYEVKYLGVFDIIGYDNSSQQVNGTFSGLLNAAGGFSGTPGPIQKNALVY
jgi:Flp pilus assembly protein TadG